MIRKLLLSSVLPLSLFAIEMPPMPPMNMISSQPVVKQDDSQKKETRKSAMPKECDAVPPMLYMLPPPLKSALDVCTNSINIPKKEFVEKKIESNLNSSIKSKKSKVKVTSIEPMKNVGSLYEIEFIVDNRVNLVYCNSNLSVCFEKPQYLK